MTKFRYALCAMAVLVIQTAHAGPPASAAPAAPKAAPLVVFDPANLLTAVQQLAEAVAQVRILADQYAVQLDIKELEEDIWMSQTRLRPYFAGVTNSSEFRLNHRRYMPDDWNCAMHALDPRGAGCTIGGHQNDFLDNAFDVSFAFDNATPDQLVERYGSGSMHRTQRSYLDYAQGASTAAMASSLTVQEDMDRRYAGIEDLIQELARGQTDDIQGMTALNARINAETAIAVQQLVRQQAQLLYLAGLQTQEGISRRISAAESLTAFRFGYDAATGQPRTSRELEALQFDWEEQQ